MLKKINMVDVLDESHIELKREIEHEFDNKTSTQEMLYDLITEGYERQDVLAMIEEVRADNAETQTTEANAS